MLNLRKGKMISYACVILFCIAILCSVKAFALEPKPDATTAKWSGENWGIVRILPRMIKYGDQVHIHGMIVGGAASSPFWSCSQYSAWTANGTGTISITVPGDWDMPYTGIDNNGSKVNVMTKDGGDPPPYGWEDRISDTCYCYITDFGANGGCQSGEVQPDLFRMMDEFNPREGNVQFATVLSGSGWKGLSVAFSGWVGVSWYDRATDYVYVVSDESLLNEDSDHDGLPDAWEYAHSPTQSLDDFAGGNAVASQQSQQVQVLSEAEWVNPYAPSEPGWVSAGPDDWDGDGFSNKEEYLKWKNNKKDSNDWPFDPTFINSKSVSCAATSALKEDSRKKDLRILRKFRDEVLSKTPAGQKLIRLYYAWSPVIVEAMEADENFMKQVQKIFDGIMPLVEKAVQ
jgi:hypothetical protein